MRTSFTKTRQIDQFIFGTLSAEKRKEFELEMLIDPDFYDRVQQQKSVHVLVRNYGRMQLQKEIASVDFQLFESNSKSRFRRFRTSIKSLF